MHLCIDLMSSSYSSFLVLTVDVVPSVKIPHLSKQNLTTGNLTFLNKLRFKENKVWVNS